MLVKSDIVIRKAASILMFVGESLVAMFILCCIQFGRERWCFTFSSSLQSIWSHTNHDLRLCLVVRASRHQTDAVMEPTFLSQSLWWGSGGVLVSFFSTCRGPRSTAPVTARGLGISLWQLVYYERRMVINITWLDSIAIPHVVHSSFHRTHVWIIFTKDTEWIVELYACVFFVISNTNSLAGSIDKWVACTVIEK